MAITYLKSKGIKYFPYECNDIDLDFMEAKHGSDGFCLALRLIEEIYKNGYYMEFSEKSMYLFLRNRSKIDATTFKDVLDTCFKERLFDRNMYEKHQILTSEKIQKQWKKIVKEAGRTNTAIDPIYSLLLDTHLELGKTPEKLTKNAEILIQSKSKRENKSKKKEKESVCVEKEPHTHDFKNSFFEKNQFLEEPVGESSDANSIIERSDEKKEKSCAQKEKKIAVRESVWLTESEIDKLKAQLSAADHDYVLDYLNAYKQSSGKKYLSDYAAIQSWGIRALREHRAKETKSADLSSNNPPQNRMESLLSNHEALIQSLGARMAHG